MSEPQNDRDDEDFEIDGASWFYVLGGIPFMIAFFVGLFVLVGYADSHNVMLPF